MVAALMRPSKAETAKEVRVRTESVEEFLARGGQIEKVSENRRTYKPWQMFCLMRGVDPNLPENAEWAKSFCKRGHLHSN